MNIRIHHKKFKPQTFVIIIACLLLLAVIINQHFTNKQGTFETLQQLESATVKYEQISGLYHAYKLWDEKDTFFGYAVQAEASGYGGPISVFSSINPNGTIKNVIIVDNCETPAYLKRIINASYLNQFISKHVSAPFEPGNDMDTISGATYTVKGIAQAVKKGAAQVGANELGIQVPSASKPILGWQEYGLLALYGLVFLGIPQRYSKLRPFVLVGSFLFLGIMLNAALSLSNITSLISGNMPSLPERPFWYLLTLGVLGITLLWGKNFYCSWLCPFGGLQEGIYKALSFMKFNVPTQITAATQKIRWGLIWTAVMLALIFNNPSLASYEPFAVSFGGSGNLGQWLTLCLVLLTSIMIYRIWCRFVCPVGVVLNLLSTLKKKMRLILSHKGKEQCTSLGSQCHSNCTECGTSQHVNPWAPWGNLENKDKVFLGMIMLYVTLIALTLFFNMNSYNSLP